MGNNGLNPDIKDNRYVIKAKTKGYYEAIKKLYNSGLSRGQIHKILDITKGNIVGLRVAKHVGIPKIWFTYRGMRYDLKADGSVTAEVRIGPAPSFEAEKKVRCSLCGKEVPLSAFQAKPRCPVCGSRLVQYRLVRR